MKSFEQDAMKHSEKAVAYIMQEYNCAQSTSAAFAEDFGLVLKMVFTKAGPFGTKR